MTSKHCRGPCARTLPLDAFYSHATGADGHLNYCKDCVKARVRRYTASIEPVKRQRTRSLNAYQRGLKRWGRDYLNQIKRAQKRVASAIRHGLLTRPDTCSWCNKPGHIEAAHIDYTRPLDITWLCRRCHHRWDYYHPKAPLS